MTTRREIVKAGAGLAAILATGRAPAAIVRSMAAMRFAATQPRKKSEQGLPYVRPTVGSEAILVDAVAVEGAVYNIDLTTFSPLRSNPSYCSMFGCRSYDEDYSYSMGHALFGVFNHAQIIELSRCGYDEEISSGISMPVGYRYNITFTSSLLSVQNTTSESTSSFNFNTTDTALNKPLCVFSVADYDPYDDEAIYIDSVAQSATNPAMHMMLHRLTIMSASNAIMHDYVPREVGGEGVLYNTITGQTFGNAVEHGAGGGFEYGVLIGGGYKCLRLPSDPGAFWRRSARCCAWPSSSMWKEAA